MLAGGCGAGSTELDAAYARGYADGVASVPDGLGAVDEAYEQGYADGLAGASSAPSDEVCQRCYGLGYADGYQAGMSSAPAATTPEASVAG